MPSWRYADILPLLDRFAERQAGRDLQHEQVARSQQLLGQIYEQFGFYVQAERCLRPLQDKHQGVYPLLARVLTPSDDR